MDLEGLARLGWDPFAIDINGVLLEQRRVVELRESVYPRHKWELKT